MKIFRKIFLLFGIIFVSLLLMSLNVSNACVVDSSSYYYKKTASDFKGIHNRLVDEEIIGFNYYRFYNFYSEKEDNIIKFSDIEDFTGYVGGKQVGDYILICPLKNTNIGGMSYDSVLTKIFNSLGGTYFKDTYKNLKTYSSFKTPLLSLSTLTKTDLNNYSDFYICDLNKFSNLTDSDLMNIDFSELESILCSMYIVEYIPMGNTCYDNDLVLSNDNDMVTSEPSIAIKNHKIIDDNFCVVTYVDDMISIDKITNSLVAYSGNGNMIDIELVSNKEEVPEDFKYCFDDIYNPDDVYLGTAYLVYKAVDNGYSAYKKIIISIQSREYSAYFDTTGFVGVNYSYLYYDRIVSLIKAYSGISSFKVVGYMFEGDDDITLINSDTIIKVLSDRVGNIMYLYDDKVKVFPFIFQDSKVDITDKFIDFNATEYIALNIDKFTYNDLISFISNKIDIEVTGFYAYASSDLQPIKFTSNDTINIKSLDKICVAYYVDDDKDDDYSVCVIQYKYSKEQEENDKKQHWYDWLLNLLNKIVEFFKKLFSSDSTSTTESASANK